MAAYGHQQWHSVDMPAICSQFTTLQILVTCIERDNMEEKEEWQTRSDPAIGCSGYIFHTHQTNIPRTSTIRITIVSEYLQ